MSTLLLNDAKACAQLPQSNETWTLRRLSDADELPFRGASRDRLSALRLLSPSQRRISYLRRAQSLRERKDFSTVSGAASAYPEKRA